MVYYTARKTLIEIVDRFIIIYQMLNMREYTNFN